ncbi:hypothetical protein B0O80DRAFT_273878 [Mortierella sp. GBAus27b]|nr:hypothetical protein B0O80DRAFT_273878 [Mortierella sp. GBAus27b]
MSSDTSYRYHNTPHRQQRTSRQHLWTPRVDDQLYPQQDQLLIQHHHPYTESQHGRTMHESDEAYPNQASHRVPRVGYRDVHENYVSIYVSPMDVQTSLKELHNFNVPLIPISFNDVIGTRDRIAIGAQKVILHANMTCPNGALKIDGHRILRGDKMRTIPYMEDIVTGHLTTISRNRNCAPTYTIQAIQGTVQVLIMTTRIPPL